MLALRHDDRAKRRAATGSTIEIGAEDAARDPARSAAEQPIELVADLHGRARGAGRVPRTGASDYVALVIDEMIPAVAREGPGRVVRRVLRARACSRRRNRARSSRPAQRAGLKPRIHADELGAERRRRSVAAEVGARSADHLIFVDDDGRRGAGARRASCATLLPAAAFFLKLGRFAPARMLIDRGVPVALATDSIPAAASRRRCRS